MGNMTTSNLFQKDESIESEFQNEFRITAKSTHEKEVVSIEVTIQ